MEILSFAVAKHGRLLCMCKLKPALSRSIVDLVYKQYGPNVSNDNIPIVVLHGLLGSKKNWNSICEKLTAATSKTVIAADARNHGESPHDNSHSYPDLAADVSMLISKLTINKAHVIGHSMGGRTAMVLGLSEPTKVASLVIVDISPVSEAGLLNNFFPKLLEVMKGIDFSGLDAGKARTLAKKQILASGLFQHEALMNFILMSLGKRRDGTAGWVCNVEALQTNFQTIATFPNMSGSKYEGPVLFIGGDQSNYIPPGDITGIKELFPKADLKYIKGVGHNVHAENPPAFVSMVTEFLANIK